MKIWEQQSETQLKIVVWLWAWWTARNKANAGGRVLSVGEMCDTVQYHLNEFAKLNGPNKTRSQVVQPKWKPPHEDLYKLNVDAAFSASTKMGGWGYVARDNTGAVLDAGAGFIQRAASALHAEALAAYQGLSRASHIGMTRVQLETDASNLGKALTSKCLDNSPEGALFRQIYVMMSNNFVSCSILICPRTCNWVADGLANHGVAIPPDEGDVFWCQAPSFVTDLVSGDLPGADSL
jgi:ribonuclease HI